MVVVVKLVAEDFTALRPAGYQDEFVTRECKRQYLLLGTIRLLGNGSSAVDRLEGS